MKIVIPALALLLAGCASQHVEQAREAEASADLHEALAGYSAGETHDCIDPKFSTGPQVIGTHTLLYRSGGTIMRNDLLSACPSLRKDSTVITEIFGGRLCRNDRFRTIEPGQSIPSGYCRLGNFTEYDRDK